MVVNGMLAAIKRLESTPYPVRWILSSGDGVADGTIPTQWNVSYLPLANRLTTEGGVPLFVAPGNHDVTGSADLGNPRRLVGLRHFLKAFSNFIPPDSDPRRLAEYPTYAFGYGNTFVMALDTNIAADPSQLTWAQQQLEKVDRTRYTHLIVDFHHPVFSSGPHGGPNVEAPTAALREKYMPLFRKYHVTALFTGHEHLFEHWVERYSDATGRHRMDEIVSGGGGAPLYAYLGEPDLSGYMMANSVTVEHLVKPDVNPGRNPYHFVIVTVDGDRMGVEVVGVDFGICFQPYSTNKMDRSGPGRRQPRDVTPSATPVRRPHATHAAPASTRPESQRRPKPQPLRSAAGDSERSHPE